MMCVINKQWIASFAQVEGTWGEIFAVAPSHCNPNWSVHPMNPFWDMVTVHHNARAFVQDRRWTECEETVDLRSVGDMQCDGWYWCWTLISQPPGRLRHLWLSASTLMELFHPDRSYLADVSYFTCSRATLELCTELLDSAKVFTGVPESNCRFQGAFKMLR